MRLLPSLFLPAVLLLGACRSTPPADIEPKAQIIVLEHVGSRDMAELLAQFLQQDAASGRSDLRIQCSDKPNALLISGSEEMVAQVLTLIARLDVETIHLGNPLAPTLEEALRAFLAEEEGDASASS